MRANAWFWAYFESSRGESYKFPDISSFPMKTNVFRSLLSLHITLRINNLWLLFVFYRSFCINWLYRTLFQCKGHPTYQALPLRWLSCSYAWHFPLRALTYYQYFCLGFTFPNLPWILYFLILPPTSNFHFLTGKWLVEVLSICIFIRNLFISLRNRLDPQNCASSFYF